MLEFVAHSFVKLLVSANRVFYIPIPDLNWKADRKLRAAYDDNQVEA
jgi:hypothetical protein